MKIKVKFEFEAELPKELWWMAYGDWGDYNVYLTLEEDEGDLAVVVSSKTQSSVQLRTVCTGMEVTEIIPNLDT